MIILHTPGPWQMEVNRRNGAPDRYFIRNRDGFTVFNNDYGPEWENARLIAAAPDLLQALQGVLYYLEGHAAPSKQQAIQWATQAVAKAEGR